MITLEPPNATIKGHATPFPIATRPLNLAYAMVFGYTSYSFYLLTTISGVATVFLERFLPIPQPEWGDLSGKTAIVSGANVGIGLEIARGLAERGAVVVLACRNLSKAQSAKDDIVRDSNGKVKSESIEVMALDCADLEAVKSFVKAWDARPLDILVNNAGIITGTYAKNQQSFELTYVTNVLSHHLLTMSLLPFIRPNGRIIHTAGPSSLFVSKSQLNPLDMDDSKKHRIPEGTPLPPTVSMARLYARTKLMQVLATRELQKRLEKSEIYRQKGITVHCFSPGAFVRSSYYRREDTDFLKGAALSMFSSLLNTIGIEPRQGAATAIHQAVSDDAKSKPGFYWYRMKVVGANRLVEDAEFRSLIFDQLTKESGLEETLNL